MVSSSHLPPPPSPSPISHLLNATDSRQGVSFIIRKKIADVVKFQVKLGVQIAKMRPAHDEERISLVDADSVGSASRGDAIQQLDNHAPEINDTNTESVTVESDVKYSAQFLVAILKPVRNCIAAFIFARCMMPPLGVFDDATCRDDHPHLRRFC
jgi:hypothetical protein